MLITPRFAIRSHRRRPVQGLSIVELLVGIAVGMFVLAGATMVVSSQISDNKRLLLETQVQQDMRAAMDIIVRDIRRSGYTKWADSLVQPVNAAPKAAVVYRPAGYNNFSASLGSSIAYSYSSKPDDAMKNAIVADDMHGFRLTSGKIEVLLGAGGYQALTDPNVVTITSFDITQQVSAPMPLPTCETTPCATPACPPPNGQYIATRHLVLTMNGQAVHDASIQRQVRATVRVRNDEVCL